MGSASLIHIRYALLLLVCAAGCQMAPRKTASPASISATKEYEAVELAYRTESDRLNSSGDINASDALPGVTQSTLLIRHPHPTKGEDVAQVTLIIKPQGDSSPLVGAFSSGGARDALAEKLATNDTPDLLEVWSHDVPAYQLEGVIGKLRRGNFFRRSKPLTSQAYLAVKIDGKAFGKNYKASPELDGMIVKARQKGQPIAFGKAFRQPGAKEVAVLRLPPTR